MKRNKSFKIKSAMISQVSEKSAKTKQIRNEKKHLAVGRHVKNGAGLIRKFDPKKERAEVGTTRRKEGKTDRQLQYFFL